MSKKNDPKLAESSHVIYALFKRGIICITFSSNYTLEGAKQRYQNLVKEFPGLQLLAIDSSGRKTVLCPTEEDIKIRRKEILRIMELHAKVHC